MFDDLAKILYEKNGKLSLPQLNAPSVTLETSIKIDSKQPEEEESTCC